MMIGWLKYKRELLRLEKILSNASANVEEVEKRLREGIHDQGELSYLAQKEDEISHWISFYQTQYYSNLCRNLVLPMPDPNSTKYYTKFNFDDDAGDRLILTIEGFKYVRDLIREERKQRREAWGFWLTMLTGIIGALIGLLSVLKAA